MLFVDLCAKNATRAILARFTGLYSARLCSSCASYVFAGRVADYPRLLCEVAGGCLPLCYFLAGAVVVYACRFLRQCLPLVVSDIALNAPQLLLALVACHFLPVIAHFFACHFVEVFLGVMLRPALKIRVKSMSAIYAADSRNASKLQ